MKFTMNFIFSIVSLVFLYSEFSYGQFVDNFEYYFPNQQIVCQKPEYWTTRNLIPCDSVEDPYISSDHAFLSQHSAKIVHGNYLIKPVPALPAYIFSFEIYIPSGKTGYFNFMSLFTPDSIQSGLECYLDEGGSGRLIHGDTLYFNWPPGTWQTAFLAVDPINGDAFFNFNENIVSEWQWSQGGIIAPQIEALGFNGITVNNEMYVDEFVIWDGCMSCEPPNPPSDLIADEIFNTNPAIKLNWEDNSTYINGFYIIRKEGYPNDPGLYKYIGSTLPGSTEYVDSFVTINQRYSYGVVTYGYYGYSDTSNFVTILVEPTPVELISFSAVSNGCDVILSWATATETNNDGFAVERCVNAAYRFGESLTGEWERIGFIEGNGTTALSHSYSYTDKNVSPGKYCYRLKQIDFNGSYVYSKEVEVNVTVTMEFKLEQNYPNPFNPETRISWQLATGSWQTLKIYDMLGREIATLVNEYKPAGSYEIEFNAVSLPSGVYFYQLRAGSFVENKKMILLR